MHLQVLRGVRFASRLGFSLALDFIETAREPAVRAALLSKVSRERVLSELMDMLDSRGHPLPALLCLHRS
jgi:tRNA nucleotidyltransferase (CCA-adding enzyme)